MKKLIDIQNLTIIPIENIDYLEIDENKKKLITIIYTKSGNKIELPSNLENTDENKLMLLKELSASIPNT